MWCMLNISYTVHNVVNSGLCVHNSGFSELQRASFSFRIQTLTIHTGPDLH